MAFSKVQNIDLEDDEEDLHRIGQAARARLKQAEAAYFSKGSTADVLKCFTEAEAAMKPLLANGGLMGLGPQDLEAVLKGRLHQAVILANLPDEPDRWSRVKSLAQDVLQFDFGNCHGRWLRGMALQALGTNKKEAEQEMWRAVECARTLGKNKEAEQWEAEIQRVFNSNEGANAEEGQGDVAPASSEERGATEVADEQAKAKPETPAAKVSGKSRAPMEARTKAEQTASTAAPTLQKGFLQRREKKAAGSPAVDPPPATAADTSSSQAAARAPTAAAIPAASGRGKVEEATATAAASVAAGQQARQLHEEAQQLLKEQRRQLEKQGREIEDLKQRLREEREQSQEQKLQSQRLRASLQEGLEGFATELEEALASEASARDASSSVREARERREAATTRRVHAAAAEVREVYQAGKAWAEDAQQKYVEAATEVLTLKEMASCELKERQDASRSQVLELRNLTKGLGDLKAAAKSLRDNVRQRIAGAPRDEKEEPEMQQLADSMADFHAMGFSAKLWALAEDVAVLRLAGISALFGMLLVLGVLIEGFGSYRCRFVCAR